MADDGRAGERDAVEGVSEAMTVSHIHCDHWPLACCWCGVGLTEREQCWQDRLAGCPPFVVPGLFGEGP